MHEKLQIIHFLNPICNMLHNYGAQKDNETIATFQKLQNNGFKKVTYKNPNDALHHVYSACKILS